MDNFWDKTHRLSEVAESLFDKLVPAIGSCATLQGELLRASSRISYDWYNNGWGCNNWSGAVNFIRKFYSELPDRVLFTGLYDALDRVQPFSRGERVTISESLIEETINLIHEIIVQEIINNPELIPNTRDMFDLQEKDRSYQEDEDEY